MTGSSWNPSTHITWRADLTLRTSHGGITHHTAYSQPLDVEAVGGDAEYRTRSKRFARIVRFRRALELVIEGDGPLVDVALEAGYGGVEDPAGNQWWIATRVAEEPGGGDV